MFAYCLDRGFVAAIRHDEIDTVATHLREALPGVSFAIRKEGGVCARITSDRATLLTVFHTFLRRHHFESDETLGVRGHRLNLLFIGLGALLWLAVAGRRSCKRKRCR